MFSSRNISISFFLLKEGDFFVRGSIDKKRQVTIMVSESSISASLSRWFRACLILIFFGMLFSTLYQTNVMRTIPITEYESLSHENNGIRFDLKHVYNNNPWISSARYDIASINEENQFEVNAWNILDIEKSPTIKATSAKIKRLNERSPDMVESYITHALSHPRINTHDSLEWSIDNVLVPNITDPETIVQLAKLASNAYAKLPIDPSWREVNDPDGNFGVGFNVSDSFGWSEGGVRGHVFVESLDENKKRPPLIIIAIKGTSASLIGGGNGGDDGNGGSTGDDGKTVELDKINDNLLFSCCCARVSSLWKTVCDCYEKAYTCNQNCLENSLRKPDKYYKATLDIYRNVVEMYPDSEVWVTGHSLGGALSSLLGRTYGLPVVTFEAPGEMLATKRLHLPMPPGIPIEMEHIWHFGNNADPIFMGVCNGPSSGCSIGGYAMESVCHSGLTCIYDTIKEKGWHVNLLNHRLKTVIDDVLIESNETAICVKPAPCIDCYDWKFVDHAGDRFRKHREHMLTSSSLPTSISSTVSSSSTSTTTSKERKCLKRTWYGTCYKWEGDDDDNDDNTGHDAKSKKNRHFPLVAPTEL